MKKTYCWRVSVLIAVYSGKVLPESLLCVQLIFSVSFFLCLSYRQLHFRSFAFVPWSYTPFLSTRGLKELRTRKRFNFKFASKAQELGVL